MGCHSIDDSLFVSTKKGEKYFKPANIVCQECYSRDVLKMVLTLEN